MARKRLKLRHGMEIELSKNKDYNFWLHQIKDKVYKLQIKAAITVNTEMLLFYWDLGREINKH